MSRFKYRAGNEEDRQAAMELAGGDLDGADFRRAKRELNKQRRRNRRAERKARGKVVTLRTMGLRRSPNRSRMLLTTSRILKGAGTSV